MTDQFDSKIEKAARKREALKINLEDAYERWLDAAIPWVAEFWSDYSRRIATDQGHITANLNAEGKLDEVKAAINDLVDNTRTHLEACIERAQWPHLSPRDDWWMAGSQRRGDGSSTRFAVREGSQLSTSFHVHAPSAMSAEQNQALGLAAMRLRDYGYEPSNTTAAHVGYGVPTALQAYPGKGWTDEMIAAINDYAQHHQEALTFTDEIAQLKAAKVKATAADLWDR